MIEHNKHLPTAITGMMFAGLIILSPTVVAAPSQTQIDALRAVYDSLNGQDWTDSSGWDTLADPCAGWSGVSCDTSGTNVTSLSIQNNGAQGVIPASISDLTELQELIIAGVGLTGSSIPASIGSLSKLKGLYLNDNQLSGSIPPELGQLSELQSLVMDDNWLSGNIPIEIMSLTKLTTLRLHHNYLAGPLPEEISSLKSLLALSLHRNSLSGVIPSSIVSLSNLNEISLDWNALHTSDATVNTFINQKLLNSVSDNYADTQTLDASTNREPEIGETAIKLFWEQHNTTPATTGGYKIYIATDAAGPYSLNQSIDDKNSDAARVEGLIANTTYFFQVRSFTIPHEENLQPNNIESSGLFYNPKEVTTLTSGSGNDDVGEAPVNGNNNNGNGGDSGGGDEGGDSGGGGSGGGGSLIWLIFALIPFSFRAKRQS